jgi:hypothetical protein
MLKEKRISVLMKTEITKIQGMNKVEYLYFKKDGQNEKEKNVEYFLKPDVIIAENGVGAPKVDI